MNLSDYIKESGVKRVAEIAQVEKATVYNWINLKSIPTPYTAFILILESRGMLNWEGVYEQYLSTTKKLSKRTLQRHLSSKLKL